MAEQLKTGTTTLGIVCKDGIVLASDKRMTSGREIFAEGVEKISAINDRMMLTMAGSVQPAVATIKLIKAETKLNKLRINRHNTVKEVANLIGNIVTSNLYRSGGYAITQFVFAGKNDDNSFELYDIYPDGTVTQIRKFHCSGSGSPYASGVLEALYKSDISIAEGVLLAKKALQSAIQKDSASGNGADIYKLTKNGVEKVESIVLTQSLV
jgi:proteasome beta subunit